MKILTNSRPANLTLANGHRAGSRAHSLLPDVRPLTRAERSRWGEIKGFIAQHKQGFETICQMLVEAREGKLYREEFDTLEKFCEANFDFGDRQGRRMFNAAVNGAALVRAGLPAPIGERQIRALNQLPPEAQVAVWAEAWRQAKLDAKPDTDTEPPTGALVEKLVKARKEAERRTAAAAIPAEPEPPPPRPAVVPHIAPTIPMPPTLPVNGHKRPLAENWRGKMSAADRAAISEALKARWAAEKTANLTAVVQSSVSVGVVATASVAAPVPSKPRAPRRKRTLRELLAVGARCYERALDRLEALTPDERFEIGPVEFKVIEAEARQAFLFGSKAVGRIKPPSAGQKGGPPTTAAR